jgi:hypothetical protein
MFKRLPTDKHIDDVNNENGLGKFVNRCVSDYSKYDSMQLKILELLKI